jgi:hypothetical protein
MMESERWKSELVVDDEHDSRFKIIKVQAEFRVHQ